MQFPVYYLVLPIKDFYLKI